MQDLLLGRRIKPLPEPLPLFRNRALRPRGLPLQMDRPFKGGQLLCLSFQIQENLDSPPTQGLDLAATRLAVHHSSHPRHPDGHQRNPDLHNPDARMGIFLFLCSTSLFLLDSNGVQENRKRVLPKIGTSPPF
ncbi:hypothetical protein L596_023303 [Steinernema carpocapsae]|uniref:Uncharacterized protein n=1 Tax=Steinernema carpocapsae TaxID=34508 RepID=A0A4U5MD87_STECR|nr:hypothetical protein L596_023303 [Steinernema carpocapsae]